MSPQGQQWVRVVVVAIAPIVFLVGVAILPYNADLTDFGAVATSAADNGDRFLVAGVVIMASLWLFTLALVSIRHWLREAGENVWSFVALPLLLAGIALLTYLVSAQAFGLRMAIEAGADGEAFLNQAESWLLALQLIAAGVLTIGVLALLLGFHRARVFSRNRFALVAVALLVGALTEFLPWGAALWVNAIALVIGFGAISQRMMQEHAPTTAGEGMAPQAPSPA